MRENLDSSETAQEPSRDGNATGEPAKNKVIVEGRREAHQLENNRRIEEAATRETIPECIVSKTEKRSGPVMHEKRKAEVDGDEENEMKRGTNLSKSETEDKRVRVVQCSDKNFNKIPHGIPYNAIYILLMNNRINSLQLDLLSEYPSLDFLALSNNRLTDGAIKRAFKRVPSLKRLYMDRNLLQSVPVDLPASLEELRLDSNHIRVMSDRAWMQCPSLSVLSLSNNSLGSGSESFPIGVFSPLSNLRTLNLDYNQLSSVPEDLPLSIKELYLKGNLIKRLPRGIFRGISGLMVLDLSANRLTSRGLVKDSLLNTTHLESLNLEGNRLKQVPRHLPASLKTLNLDGNLISSIKKAAFTSLKSMEHLSLAKNKITKVAAGAFRALSALHQLDLCHNVLQQVPRHLPGALHSVALSYNRIQSVPRDAFCWGNQTLSGLVRVQLEHNFIDFGELDMRAVSCLRGSQVVHFY
ncbi:decorin [Oryzias melastigma]|uniref:decorin n=1 Tax=Oryzias melastigma TaxID=30732 RepID=UPI00168D953C|nr:decorin [Oryzias melastigma]